MVDKQCKICLFKKDGKHFNNNQDVCIPCVKRYPHAKTKNDTNE